MRIELLLGCSSAKENKFLFNELRNRQAEVESNFGQELEWLPMEDKKSSKIQFRKPFDSDNRDNWPEMVEWLVSNMTSLEKALTQPLVEADSKLKVLGIAESDD